MIRGSYCSVGNNHHEQRPLHMFVDQRVQNLSLQIGTNLCHSEKGVPFKKRFRASIVDIFPLLPTVQKPDAPYLTLFVFGGKGIYVTDNIQILYKSLFALSSVLG